MILRCYRQQRSCEGYVFTGVCLSTGGGLLQAGVPGPGGCLVPGEGSASGGMPGPGGGVCSSGVPGPGGSAPRGVPGPGWGVVSQHALRQTPPGETATAADGTHPTGMHSCSGILFDMNFFCREKLDAWLKSKNKTPSRFRHLMCFGGHIECRKTKDLNKKVKGGLTPQQLDHQVEPEFLLKP